VAIASVGFVVFVFCGLVLLGAEAMRKTRNQSSLLEGQRDIADEFGWGKIERFKQSEAVLLAQVWIMRAVTLAAFCFTCWHAASAVDF
jgi:hypothetical protein